MKQSSLPWTLANLGSHSTDRSYHALHENACRLLNFVLGNRLKKVLSRVADIICITQITYKMINNALLMENWRLVFFRFENLFLFLAYINWLQSGANFIIKIMQLPPNSIGWNWLCCCHQCFSPLCLLKGFKNEDWNYSVWLWKCKSKPVLVDFL